jgi:hypothetical protein
MLVPEWIPRAIRNVLQNMPMCRSARLEYPVPSCCLPCPFLKKECFRFSKSSVFWDVSPWSLLKINVPFLGKCRHHLQGPRKNQAGNQSEHGRDSSLLDVCFMLVSCLNFTSTLRMETAWSYEILFDIHWATRLSRNIEPPLWASNPTFFFFFFC